MAAPAQGGGKLLRVVADAARLRRVLAGEERDAASEAGGGRQACRPIKLSARPRRRTRAAVAASVATSIRSMAAKAAA